MANEVQALRYNSGKPRMSLVPSSLITYTAYVMSYGEQKYSANNWRKGFKVSEVLDSLERHLMAYREGEDYDAESGLPMLCHIAFNVAVLIEQFDKGTGIDDRYKVPKSNIQLAFNPPPPPPPVTTDPRSLYL